MKTKYLGIRLDETTYNWLEQVSEKSGATLSEVVRETLTNRRMSDDTRAVYGKCLGYLASLDHPEFLSGLEGLIEVLKDEING